MSHPFLPSLSRRELPDSPRRETGGKGHRRTPPNSVIGTQEANNLALNLMHDMVTGAKTVAEARDYYAKEFLDYRRKKPTPYMDRLHFEPGGDTADVDERVLSDQDLEKALEEGKAA